MLNKLKYLYKIYVKRPFAWIEFSFPVWSLLNRKSRRLYKNNPPKLDSVQQRIVKELETDGISITHIDDLFKDNPSLFKEIMSELDTLVPNAKQDPKKDHFKALWDTRSFYLDPKNSFVKFALSPKIIDVANAYMKMWTRLLLANGYIADVVPKSASKIKTQNWHRDAHDLKLVSVFIYLTDVMSEGDGAFFYVKKSHPGAKLGQLFPQPKPHSLKRFPSEEEVDAKIKSEDIVPCLGKKGTIIFSDGTGIHRGGYCTDNRRIMVLTAYTSDHRFTKTARISYPSNVESLISKYPPQSLYAVKLEKN